MSKQNKMFHLRTPLELQDVDPLVTIVVVDPLKDTWFTE